MISNSQKDYFLDGEGDAFFRRNKLDENKVNNIYGNKSDPLLHLITNIPLKNGKQINILEIGCGQALRLNKLHQIKGWNVFGIDPSEKAVKYAQNKGINCKVATADELPYEDNTFDLIIYGFCLYVCDREDLFKIASEANRVLKESSWIVIFDFWHPYKHENKYHHLDGLKSYKMDLQKMFSWHPSYIVMDHSVRHHSQKEYTDESGEWVASTLIRKTKYS